MKHLLVILALVTTTAQAETIITSQGNYVVNQSSSTTYVTGPSRSSSVTVAVPVTVNPITGVGQVHTPQGSYLVQRSGSTTTVIQTSRGK